jgi:hypothetical protein
MKRTGFLFLRRLLKNLSGQTGVVVAASMSGIVLLGGVSVEVGHIYYAYQQLVASTNSAALAGASQMPDVTVANTYVTDYSVETGQLNATNFLQNASISTNYFCSATVGSSLNVGCQQPPTGEGACSGSATTCNALAVTQTAYVPLWFGGLIGMHQMKLVATATAAMRGGFNTPWNIAIIEDTTASMKDEDGGDQCDGEQITCALDGLRSLLVDLYPCALGQTCTSSGTAAVDSVSLFVFPAVTNGTASDDYSCPTSNPTIVAYTFPDPPSSLTLPSADTYQVVTWSNDYKTVDSSSTLNNTSDIVIAAGGATYQKETSTHPVTYTTTSCGGLQAPGGEGTYYAQVIYAAQTALVAEQKANPGSQNAIILLSDGDATACASNAYTTAGACNSSSQIVATQGTLNGTGTSTTNPTGYNSPNYPSAVGECGQAVQAAQSATQNGTVVYVIGYGSEASGGCLSDQTYTLSGNSTYGGGAWPASSSGSDNGRQPCDAMRAMASASANFYSDDGDGCKATNPTNANITKLTQIFQAITDNMSSPRLIPNGTT